MNVTAMNVTATTSMTTIGPLLALSLSVFLNVWLYRARKEDAAKLSAIQSESPSFLPEGWWSSPSRFQDERRAIFSQVSRRRTS
jgi:hypothetical protein